MEMATSERCRKSRRKIFKRENASRFAKGDIVIVRRHVERDGTGQSMMWPNPLRIVEVDGGRMSTLARENSRGGVEKNVEEGDLKKKETKAMRRALSQGRCMMLRVEKKKNTSMRAWRIPTRAKGIESQHACMNSLN